MNQEQLEVAIAKIKNMFKKNGNKEIYIKKIKKELCIIDKETNWGSVVFQLTNRKIIEKSANFEKENGKSFFYYKPGQAVLNDQLKGKISYKIFDQHNNVYTYSSDELLDQTLNELLMKNPSLELTVCKPIRTVKAELKFVTFEV